jgi:hypothetical protein
LYRISLLMWEVWEDILVALRVMENFRHLTDANIHCSANDVWMIGSKVKVTKHSSKYSYPCVVAGFTADGRAKVDTRGKAEDGKLWGEADPHNKSGGTETGGMLLSVFHSCKIAPAAQPMLVNKKTKMKEVPLPKKEDLEEAKEWLLWTRMHSRCIWAITSFSGPSCDITFSVAYVRLLDGI